MTETLLNAHLGYREKRDAQQHNEVNFFLKLHFFDCLLVLTDNRSRFYKHFLGGNKAQMAETLLNAHLGYREKRDAQQHNEVNFFLKSHLALF